MMKSLTVEWTPNPARFGKKAEGGELEVATTSGKLAARSGTFTSLMVIGDGCASPTIVTSSA